ncbi:MAG: hypothetical protein DMG97_26860 [Acidobacteria bacterium]|nr:MAG: hypothetical protein DMG97_26860 [Acidobacteriota bacterium]
MNRRFGAFAIQLCVAVTLAFALLAVGEGIACWMWRAAPPEELPTAVYKGDAWAPSSWREWNAAANKLQYRSYVVWRKAAFSGVTINIDQDGLRRTYYSSCGQTGHTIWMFGDSALWGAGSPDWATIPSLLAKQYRDTGNEVCVVNFGEKAWVSTQETIQLLLALKAAEKKPDLVLFYDGVSDAFLPYQTSLPDAHENLAHIKRLFEGFSKQPGFQFLQESNTYALLRRMRAHLETTEKSRADSPLSAEQVAAMARITYENYLKNMEIVELLGRHYGFSCFFFWQPTLFAGHKPMTGHERHAQRLEEQGHPGVGELMRVTYDLFRAIRQPDFFYLADIFNRDEENRFLDFSHVGPAGNQLVERRMFEVLERHGYAGTSHSNQGSNFE